ncbi:VOC family protein [Corynebacterium sp.]|uniref:VOC family protein n=1 Tax=Corynebacterium sp. TaxID=1720 RepID=UPI0026DCB933|nr:VOC family protein [Corynebacterium sp.]MDO5076498.1 VOC family protein [Corynebacterium sp.]
MAKTWVNPYLHFRDSTREVMSFYHSIFGGKLDMMTFGEAGQASSPEQAELIMHAHLETADGWTFMAADVGIDFHPDTSIQLAIGGQAVERERVAAWFDALSDGGAVVLPLAEAPWGDMFGQVRDRFGVTWMVNISVGSSAAE